MAEISEKGHEHEKYEEKQDSQNVESDSQNQYSSDSQNRESPPYDVDSLPQSASSWRRENIEEMKINIDESTYSSSDLVIFITEKLLKDKKFPGAKLVSKLASAIESLEVYRHLDCPFDQLGMENFKNAGKWFTENLLKCIDKRENGQSVSEAMYQQLFMSYLQLFNIKCDVFPAKRSMKIRGKEITGTPDLLIESVNTSITTEEDRECAAIDVKTLVVCEVKKECRRRFSSPVATTQNSLPNGLIGQNCCELLLYHPLSMSKDHIIGMVVEQTHKKYQKVYKSRGWPRSTGNMLLICKTWSRKTESAMIDNSESLKNSRLFGDLYIREIGNLYSFSIDTRSIYKDDFEKKTIPWKQIMTSFPVYAFIIMVFASDWGFLFLSTFVPSFLSDVFQFGSQNGLYYLTKLVSNEWFDFIVAVYFNSCCNFSRRTGMIGFSFAGFLENALDIDPQYASIIFGLGNVGGGLGGYLSSVVVGSLTVNHTLEEWQMCFYIAAAVEISGALFYLKIPPMLSFAKEFTNFRFGDISISVSN
ncbi:hypothetical protein KUTeg_000791 [Tegillarca granosa]|uniref:Uncharacterized protein n=1 Tax=Tegillarca granosa TaxID=220873 RepID=A0ABQ9G2V2_TEGGR|nr:hypothetical protein KUTeg_000791 [Tegillarca granosa]